MKLIQISNFAFNFACVFFIYVKKNVERDSSFLLKMFSQNYYLLLLYVFLS